MTPHYADDWLTVYHGDARAVMAELSAESVHCVVTSPPYWGLRDYGTASWEGGDEECDHVERRVQPQRDNNGGLVNNRIESRGEQSWTEGAAGQQYRHTCGKCGAIRQDSQLGLEPTPEQYVENMVAVFREVRRVLRSDGTVWLNLGDSYNTSPPGNKPNTTALSSGLPNSIENQEMRRSAQAAIDKTKATGLKPKDLVGIPWRVAFALQADGWYLRSDIIWSKPNPMPESVTDRPTKSHEYLFLLSKSARYYYDADAVREAQAYPVGPDARISGAYQRDSGRNDGSEHRSGGFVNGQAGRNLRSVWSIATAPYPGAHFATFPPKLVEPCIKAGTSEKGVCPECGAPWVRVVERTLADVRQKFYAGAGQHGQDGRRLLPDRPGQFVGASAATTGWRPSCSLTCDYAEADRASPVPATVLDPFAGSGTTGMVAQSLSRRAILIDLSMDYLDQLMKRNRDIPLGLAESA